MKRAGYVFRLSVIALLAAAFCADACFGTDAELPKVLIIGDSISIGYTPYVKELLAGKAIVKHNPGNAEDTVKGLGTCRDTCRSGNGRYGGSKLYEQGEIPI